MKLTFHHYAVFTIFLWSFAYILTRLAMPHFSALTLCYLRCVIASLTLLGFCLAAKTPLPKKRDLPWFAAAAAAGFSVYLVAFNIGTAQVTAATSSLVISSVPIITAFMANFILREHLLLRQWLAIAIEFLGIAVLSVHGGAIMANTGVLWLLFASVLLSCYQLIQRRLTRTYPALPATTYGIVLATIMLLVFTPQAAEEVMAAPPIQWLYVSLLAIFPSALAFITWSKALAMAEKTSMVSNYMFFTPLVTGFLGYALIGEKLEMATVLGGLLIIFGAVLYSRSPFSRKTDRTRA